MCYVVNIVFVVVFLVGVVEMLCNVDLSMGFWLVVVVFVLLGIGVMLLIGGVDMFVVIFLLNSYFGVVVVVVGFVVGS